MMVMTSNSYRWSPGSISGEVKFIFLLPWNLRVETMGEGDHESADSCKIVEVEGVGTVELVFVGRLLRVGCGSFVMLLCKSVRSGEPGSRMGYHRNILLRTNGGRRGRDRKPDFVTCSARIVSGWVVVEWGTESYSGLAGDTYFVYLALRTSALEMGQTVRLGKRNTYKGGMEIYFYLVLWSFYFLFAFDYILCVKFLQNFQVIVTSLDLCGWPGKRVPQSPDCWSSCNIQGKMREGGEDDDKGMICVTEGVRSLGGRDRCWVPWGIGLF